MNISVDASSSRNDRSTAPNVVPGSFVSCAWIADALMASAMMSAARYPCPDTSPIIAPIAPSSSLNRW